MTLHFISSNRVVLHDLVGLYWILRVVKFCNTQSDVKQVIFRRDITFDSKLKFKFCEFFYHILVLWFSFYKNLFLFTIQKFMIINHTTFRYIKINVKNHFCKIKILCKLAKKINLISSQTRQIKTYYIMTDCLFSSWEQTQYVLLRINTSQNLLILFRNAAR